MYLLLVCLGLDCSWDLVPLGFRDLGLGFKAQVFEMRMFWRPISAEEGFE